jgi:hypothetical protein
VETIRNDTKFGVGFVLRHRWNVRMHRSGGVEVEEGELAEQVRKLEERVARLEEQYELLLAAARETALLRLEADEGAVEAFGSIIARLRERDAG